MLQIKNRVAGDSLGNIPPKFHQILCQTYIMKLEGILTNESPATLS